MKNKIIVVITLVLLIMGLSGCTQQEEDPLKGLSYINSEYGFGMNPPAGWEINVSTPNVTVAFSGPMVKEGRVNIGVSAMLIEPGKGLYATADSFIENYTNIYENVSLISRGNRTVNGMYAYEILFAVTMYGSDFKQKFVSVENNEKCLFIGYTAPLTQYDLYEPLFEDTLNSFVVIW